MCADVSVAVNIVDVGGSSAFPEICTSSVPQTLPLPRTQTLAYCARRPILHAQVRSNQSARRRLISLGFHINPPVLQSHTRPAHGCRCIVPGQRRFVNPPTAGHIFVIQAGARSTKVWLHGLHLPLFTLATASLTDVGLPNARQAVRLPREMETLPT